MLFRNARLENSSSLTDFRIADGKFVELSTVKEDGTSALLPLPQEEVIDLGGKLVLPPFVEPHIHLDSALTAGEPRFNLSGTLFEGIDIWSERKHACTHEEVKERAFAALQMMAKNGVQFVRSHADCTDPKLTALRALCELRDELKGTMELQIVAFPQEGIHSFPNGKELIRKALEIGADVVGAIPHFEFTREYSVDSLNYIIELAQEFDVLVDVHCDEIDDGASRGLETLAARALETGLADRVTASHTTATHSYNNAYFSKLTRLLRMSEINFVCNPLVNTHLQGRFDTYPKRRGVTRVKELLEAGCNVAFGHDDVRDPWYPMGDGNPMDVTHMGIHVNQMMGYQQIMDSYKMVTHNAARCLHLEDNYGIAAGRPAHFIVLNADTWYDALNTRAEVLSSYHGGKLIAQTQPRLKEILF
ncbi:cytosine deaminase [Actinomycetaceae bacterium TAE3-ERU4]|nr:cytosine deaminase [Actinomycetaceae bacterium TAE3-ERU4]